MVFTDGVNEVIAGLTSVIDLVESHLSAFVPNLTLPSLASAGTDTVIWVDVPPVCIVPDFPPPKIT